MVIGTCVINKKTLYWLGENIDHFWRFHKFTRHQSTDSLTLKQLFTDTSTEAQSCLYKRSKICIIPVHFMSLLQKMVPVCCGRAVLLGNDCCEMYEGIVGLLDRKTIKPAHLQNNKNQYIKPTAQKIIKTKKNPP